MSVADPIGAPEQKPVNCLFKASHIKERIEKEWVEQPWAQFYFWCYVFGAASPEMGQRLETSGSGGSDSQRHSLHYGGLGYTIY